MDILITGGKVVNQGRIYGDCNVLVCGGRIAEVGRELSRYDGFTGRRIDARGMIVMPGVIDDHVHFREPGLTHKGDIASESRAAVAGGVTSYMDMPNTLPAATTLGEVERKEEIAAASSMANYSFYLGATNDNIREIKALDPRRVCGVKLFMGSSTGNMLVDADRSISAIFAESPVPVAAHCEDERMIRENAAAYRAKFGDAIQPAMHAAIRSAEAC